MKQLNALEYLKLSKIQRFLYKVAKFFVGIPKWFLNLFIKIGLFFKNFGQKCVDDVIDVFNTFKYGDYKTRLSFVIMGFGSIARGQFLRGILFFLFEVVFIVYMLVAGVNWLSKLPTLGTLGPEVNVYSEEYDTYITIYHDNSFKILLYSILTIFFIIAFIYTYRLNIKQNKIAQQIIASGKKLKSSKDDIKNLADNEFHKTLLALPLTGIIIFTFLPIIFMILVAFTNYDGSHNGYYNNLFTWVGLDNFNKLLGIGQDSSYFVTFGEVLAWTLMWAFFATFSNYFLGLLVAMIINKKGIKFKKFWRTVLVLSIAVPQFISLLYISKMFAYNGIINGLLSKIGISPIKWLNGEPWLARLTIIIINIWIGIPYLMLITSGILMNIPEDLYESSKIDGASAFQQFVRITLPYMLFVTGPYLLTSFISNMNNFNVIYLLSKGEPINTGASGVLGTVGYTDLLVTWLFKITQGAESSYYMASVIGIVIFIVVAVISLIIYNVIPSTKNEEDFQ